MEQINEIIVKKEEKLAENEDHNKRVEPDTNESKSDSLPAFVNPAFDEIEDVKRSNENDVELVERNYAKVVPLYTPDNAVIKIFMIHGSDKSALALASFARGFQNQVTN